MNNKKVRQNNAPYNLVKIELKEQTQTPKPTSQLSEDFVKQIEKEFFGME